MHRRLSPKRREREREKAKKENETKEKKREKEKHLPVCEINPPYSPPAPEKTPGLGLESVKSPSAEGIKQVSAL